MDPQGPPKEIPLNIDPNAWQIVLRDGVPTLVPRQPEPAALIRFNNLQNRNPPVAGNMLITQTAYEQGLALDYASQNTPLSEQQHQFLSSRLQALRGTIEHLEHNINQRRALTMNHEANLTGSQVPSLSGSNPVASTSHARPRATQPNQQNQNTSQGGNSVYYNNIAQNPASGSTRNPVPTYGSNHQTQQQATMNVNAQTTKSYLGQISGTSNAESLPPAAPTTANAPTASHHRHSSSQEQRRQMFQQSQQTYVNLSRPLDSAASQRPYVSQQLQASTSRGVPNPSIPQPSISSSHHQPAQGTAVQAQAGVQYFNGNQADYRARWPNAGQVNNSQTPSRQPNLFSQAQISPVSTRGSPYQPVQSNATHPAARSNVSQSQHQQPTTPSGPTTVHIPPTHPEWGQQPTSRAYVPQPSSRQPNSTSRPSMPNQSTLAAVPPPGTYRPPRRQSQTTGVPQWEPAPPLTSALGPLLQLPPPPTPVEAPILPAEIPVKKELEEELSLAQSVLLLYGKRKAMDSAGSPGPASKRRATEVTPSAERHGMDASMPNGGGLVHPPESGGILDGSSVDEFHPMEGMNRLDLNGSVASVNPAGADMATESPTSMVGLPAREDVSMDRAVLESIHPETTVSAQTVEPPQGKEAEGLPRIEILSDGMDVPDASRSPSAARIPSVSVSDAQDLVRDHALDVSYHEASEAEVEGAVMVDGESNDHQMTPVPETKSPSPPLYLPLAPSGGARGDAERLVTPMPRSPSIPLFQSTEKQDAERRKRKGVARSKSPSEPLFLPVASSSSSDAEIVISSPKKTIKSTAPSGLFPRRRFLGVSVPFIPGFSREIQASRGPRSRPFLVRRRLESSSSSDDESTGVISGMHPVISDNDRGIDPYSLLELTPCLWAGCDSRLDSLMKLMKHVEIIHTAPESSVKHPRCRWDGCRRQRSSFGDSTKLLRHVIKHISPEMTCMVADCPFSTRNREEFQQHYDESHKDDQIRKFKPSTFLDVPPQEPNQSLPDFTPVSEALYLPIYGNPEAMFRSRPPSPQATSQTLSTMLLSPTKHSPRWRDAEEKKIDEYSFLEPFYPPSLHMDDIAQNAIELFERECYDLDADNPDEP